MTSEELLRSAQEALQAGDRRAAAGFYARLVQEQPSSDAAWLGLGLSLDDPEKRLYCFRRALQLNPGNAGARQALEGSSSPPATPQPLPRPTTPPSAGISPGPASSKKPQAPSAASAARPASGSAPPGASRKPLPPSGRRRRGWVWLVVIVFFCILGVGGLYLAGNAGLLAAILPPGLFSPVQAVHTPSLAPSTPTTLATATSTLEPTLTLTPTPLPWVAYTPVFEPVDCPPGTPSGVEVLCGYVRLPENRTRSAEDTIRLRVVEYRATGADPLPDPVIFLQGGPGAGAVELSADAWPVLVEPFLARQTFITFDQRGTGLSEPVLECTELTQVYSQDLRGLVPPETRHLVYLNAFRACHDLLNINGIDLAAYTTLQNAADVRDVLSALGYSRADLYSASYGTRLAQVVMREYPGLVRSAVLDSMLPLDLNIYAGSAQTAREALATLFAGCAQDEACSQAFPNLEADFWSLVDSLNASPLSVPVVVPYLGGRSYVPVDGQTYLGQVLASMKQTSMVAGIPLAIAQVRSGDTSSLSYTLGFPPVDWDLQISLGMYISVMCHEYILDSSLEVLDAGLTGEYDNGVLGWFPFVGDGGDFIDLCQAWEAVPPSPGEDAPLVSDIPTLVLAGRYDSITPPSFGRLVAQGLTNSWYLEFPDQGHAPSAAAHTTCPMTTVLSFFADPQAGPDDSCLAGEQPPRFLVPYTGETPIPLASLSLEADDILVRVPSGWTEYGSGLFIRGSSGLDITQLNVFRVAASPAVALHYLSERTFYGRMMLDSEPVPGGEELLGGYQWTYYTTTSFGTPVDMAMANDRGTTLMVILFTHTNERDALRRDVFLPVVASVRSSE